MHKKKVTARNANKEFDVIEKTVIRYKDISTYLNSDFYTALWAWSMTKRWGTANNLGWANEPMSYIEAITIIDDIHNTVENEKMEAKLPKVKDATGEMQVM